MTAVELLLARVRAAGGEVRPDGESLVVEAPEPLPVELVEALRARKGELVKALTAEVSAASTSTLAPENRRRRRAESPADSLPEPWQGRLRQATSWDDLSQFLDDAQIAFVAGDLPGEVVERLAVQANILSRCLPEVAPPDDGSREIPADDLLPPGASPDTCYACRRTAWWTDRYGVPHCRVCHPPPPRAEA